ncbi:MAG: hypothetical protein FWE12_01880 [Oscillospiraceae bacterium]|nr:hypothetical protein [Oscillospiraceae bacterium]
MRITVAKTRILAFILALALISSLAACGGGGGTEADTVISDAPIAAYAFVPTYFELETGPSSVRSIVHNDRIYYFFAPWQLPDAGTAWDAWEATPLPIIIASMAADGTDPRRTEIQVPDTSMIDVVGLAVTDEGHYAILYTDTAWGMTGSSIALFYAAYDADGNELFSQEITGVAPQGGAWFRVTQTLFTGDYILLRTQGMGGSAVYILDENRAVRGRLDVDFQSSLSHTADGRVFVLDWDSAREVNLAVNAWGETFPISVAAAAALFPAAAADDFDFIIDDRIHLIGYNLATGEQTLLLNWIESGVAAERDYHVNFLDDGRIAVLISDAMFLSGSEETTELIILSRTPRSELPVREIITLGGFNISGDVRSQVVAFNRTSQTHQIQVTDYRMHDTNEDRTAGIARFRAELTSGGGPDIILGDSRILGTAVERGFLADLYPFLDADPELRRSDFFQNILSAMEMPDGTLPLISNSFSIQTMVGMAENVDHIHSWTLAALLELLDQTADEDMPYILGEWLTGDSFLSTILLFGDAFINWTERRVNLENEEFLHLLEIVRRLPDNRNFGGGGGGFILTGHVTAYERMQRGEQLLDMATLSNPLHLQVYTATLGEVIALGVPTPDGGAHLVQISDGLGINAASPHQEEAWTFIRQFLLADAPLNRIWGNAFPLRIDQYEEVVATAMQPEFFINEYGEEIEQPRGMVSFGGSGFMVSLYAMTAAEANSLRTIVESANRMGRFDETVMDMVTEELLPFLAGDRSAADTARILQNRIQTYMNEQR